MKTSTKNAIITGIFTICGSLVTAFCTESVVSNNYKNQNSEIENDIVNSGINTNAEDSMQIMVNQLINEYNDYKNEVDSLSAKNSQLTKENDELKTENNNLNNLYSDSIEKIDQLNYQLAEFGQKTIDNDDDSNDLIIQETPSDFLFNLDTMSLHTPENNFYEMVYNLDDSIGNNHDNVILCGAKNSSDDKDTNSLYAEYYINKQYISLKGNIVIPEETKNCDDVYVVYFYGDDEYITETDNMTIGSLPYEFDIPLAGVTKLKIKVVRTEKNSGNSSIAITEARFYK